MREAFEDRSIRRGLMLVDGDLIACQTWIEGRLVREFTKSPIGPLPPNGQVVTWDIINIFRMDDQGRILEEWVRGDNRALLRQMGGAGR